MQLDPTEIRRILVIKLRAIGDVLLSTIVTKNLRTFFPAAKIDFLTERASRGVLAGNKYVDEIIVFEPSPLNSLRILSEIRRRNYELVIDLFGNPRSAVMTVASGAAHRVGYAFRLRKFAYNIVVQPRGDSVHNTEFNLDALRAIGIQISDRNIHFPLSLQADNFATQFLQSYRLDDKILVALNVGGGWYTKRWRLEQYAALGNRLVEELAASVILLWGPGEYQYVEKLRSLMKHDVIVPPRTDLKQLGALLKKCTFLVTNDSAPMHIAAAVGTPVVGIFGPTSPKLQGPYGDHHAVVRNERLDCLECNLMKCPIGNICMTELDVDEVMMGVEKVLVKIRHGNLSHLRV
ncbi:MAG: glycosyltransferase family 9 protein [Bacteroidota bacterium]